MKTIAALASLLMIALAPAHCLGQIVLKVRTAEMKQTPQKMHAVGSNGKSHQIVMRQETLDITVANIGPSDKTLTVKSLFYSGAFDAPKVYSKDAQEIIVNHGAQVALSVASQLKRMAGGWSGHLVCVYDDGHLVAAEASEPSLKAQATSELKTARLPPK